MTVAAPPATAHAGALHATFSTREDGATILGALHTRAPLRLAPARTREDGGLDVCITECSPGQLPGDAYDLAWNLAAGARVRVGSQAALRVHGGGGDAGPSRVVQRATVEQGALLEVLPEPVVLHAGADWRSATSVDLHGDAAVVFAEVGTAGRVAHGERFAFARWEARLDVRIDGQLVAASAQRLEPGATLDLLDAPGWLGGATHWASLHVVCARLDTDPAEALRSELDALVLARPDVDGCADLAPRAGVVVVARAQTAWALTTCMRALADAARPHLVR
ncbi:MAG: urease accessory protein UreH [Thermoleophilia bacterium]|nr:urease accessory protein UreH [Thermoleophilia bacterium]